MRYWSMLIMICLGILTSFLIQKEAAGEQFAIDDRDYVRSYEKQMPDPQAEWESNKIAYDMGRIFKIVLIGIVVIFIIGWCIGKF
ncbi:MAG: hypothetical protein Q8O22_08215 [Candidatus Omnitrophota bacterium]|nr:hypothetical protein [Candidatus Omnitrophota bacterium]